MLAVDPTSRGFGFAVLEGPQDLIDWGVKQVRARKTSRSLKAIQELMQRYRPEMIVKSSLRIVPRRDRGGASGCAA